MPPYSRHDYTVQVPLSEAAVNVWTSPLAGFVEHEAHVPCP